MICQLITRQKRHVYAALKLCAEPAVKEASNRILQSVATAAPGITKRRHMPAKLAASIRNKYLTLFAVVALALWAGVLISLQILQERTLEETKTSNRALAQILAEHVGSSVRAIDMSMLRLRDVWSNDPENFAAEVEKQKKFLVNQSILQVGVTDINGWVVWNSTTGKTPVGRVSVADREHFQIHKKRLTDELFVGMPVLGRTSKQWTIQFTRPIFDRRNRLQYVMTLSVPPPALEKVYDNLTPKGGSRISLVRSDGIFLARSGNFDRARNTTLDPAKTPGLNAADPDYGENRRTSVIEKTDSIITYRKVSGYPLAVFITWGIEAGMSDYFQLRQTYQVSAFLITAMLLMLTLLLITRRRSEAQDAMSRARLAAMVDSAHDAIVTRDLDGRVLSWNASAERLFGYQSAEIIGKDVLALLSPPEIIADSESNRIASMDGTQQPSHDSVRITKDGRHMPVSVVLSPLHDADGKIIGHSIVYRDISERKNAEAARAQLAAIVENANDAIIGRSLDGKIVSWNNAAERMFGYTAAQAIGCQGILTPPELLHERDPTIALLKAGKIPPNLVTQRLTRDGRRLDVSISEAPVRDERNELTGYATIIRDITEQKRAEQALIESERRLAGFVESAMDAIITIDEQHRIRVFNQAACQMFGCTTAEAMGAPIEDFMPTRFRSTHAAHMRKFGEDGVTTRSMGRTGKVRALRSDGSEFPVDASISQAMVAGQRMFSVILRDISEQVAAERVKAELEAQIRETQKMEALGTLSGGIAHDFNNILGAITGNLQLLREDLGNNPNAMTSLDEIAKASTRAKDLVKQILDFTRRETPDFKVHAVRPLIEESVRMMRATLPPSIQIKSSQIGDALSIRANESQVSQVLLNLCTNAWHAMAGNKGSICLSVDSVELTRASTRRGITLQPGRYVRIAVEDDGSGMDAVTQERIFEPFFTSKPVGQGTGLGLSVVHGIIRSHHGFIDLKSAPGLGSTFEIYIPEAIAAVPAPAQIAAPSNSTGSDQHVAYIDDDEAMVFMVKRLLTRRGFRVSTFATGNAALAAVRAAPESYDLVVTDYNMPQESGLDVARELHDIHTTLPVMLISGYITDETRNNAEALGIRYLVEKQNSIELLADAIVAALRP